ncbi:PDxFFG protein [Mycoplasma mycoides subsp. capri]|uniref:PDxFFG protein n=1 Tax=Mycoplasma mycoides TaxID=2102 RepID=UPI00223FD78B|nr:PDxFFG protein [Mycoplasma mycoides]UZK64379.1 PDxFFG protein [Mycoplasma mycoides subsp. capri]
MPKINFKKYVWHKYAISASLIIAATTAILGSAYKYSNTSVEKLGRKNFSDEESFKNAFIDPNALPVTQFSEIHNNKFKVDYDPLKDVVKVNGKELSVDKYLDQYYKKYHALPYLNIRYGSFNFYNQYIEAVSPQEFFKFTKWFMKNVSWGPEIITLKSFSIVKGVEMNGNSITLGAHSNKNKEETTIKFYPDAFFGTLPIYSSLSGRGNAHESLTYKLNQQVLTKKDLESFLTNISNYNSLANLSQQTIDKSYFRGITNVSFLKGQKVFAYKQPNWYHKFSKVFSQLEKNRLVKKSQYLFIVAASNEKEAREKLVSKFNEYKNNDSHRLLEKIDPNKVKLEEKTISFAKVKANSLNDSKILDKELILTFNDGSDYVIHNAFSNVLTEQVTEDNKKKFVALNNYVQFSKAKEELNNKVKNIESQIDEQIKLKLEDKNFDLKTLKDSLETFIDLNELYRKYLTLNQNISNMEIEVKNFSSSVERIKKLDEQQKQLQKKLKTNGKDEKEKKELEQSIETTKNLIQQIKGLINLNKYKTDKEKLISERKTLSSGLENQIKKIEESIIKSQNDINLKTTLEKELRNIKFTLENVKQLNEDDQKVLDEIKKINTTSSQEFKEENTKKIIEILTDAIKVNQQRTKKLLDGQNGTINNKKKEILSKFKIKEKEVESVSNLMALYESFKFDTDIAKLSSDKENNTDGFELTKTLKNADKKVFDLENQLLRSSNPNAQLKKYVEKEYYGSDVAYTSAELISLETLVETNNKTKLNWRDFYNLEQFFNDRLNNAKDGSTDFFVYSKHTKDLSNDIDKLTSNLGVEHNYTNLVKQKQDLNAQLSKANSEIKSYEEKIGAVKQLLTTNFSKKNKLPNDFYFLGLQPGFEVLDPIKNKNAFNRFFESDPENISKYLEMVLGEKLGNDYTKKTSIKSYLDNLSTSEKDLDSKKLISLISEINLLTEKVNSGSADANDIKKFADYTNKLTIESKKWDEKSNSNVSSEQLTSLVQSQKDFEKLLKFVESLKGSYSSYKEQKSKQLKTQIELQKVDYQLDFINSTPILTSKELNKAYSEVIKTFNSSSKDYNKKASSTIDSNFKSNNNFAKLLIDNMSSESGDSVRTKQLLFDTDVKQLKEALEKSNKKLESAKKSAENKSALESANKSLIKSIQETHTTDGKNLKDEILALAQDITNYVDEFTKDNDKNKSVYAQIQKYLLENLQKIEAVHSKVFSEYSDLQNKIINEKDAVKKQKFQTEYEQKANTLNQVNNFLIQTSENLGQLEANFKFNKKWSVQLNNLLEEIKKDKLPALATISSLRQLDAEVAEILNNKEIILESNIQQHFARLKTKLTEILKELVTKYAIQVNDQYQRYNVSLTSYEKRVSAYGKVLLENQKLKRTVDLLEKYDSSEEAKKLLNSNLKTIKEIEDLDSKSAKEIELLSDLFTHNSGKEGLSSKIKEVDQKISDLYLNDASVKENEKVSNSINDKKSALNKELEKLLNEENKSGFTDVYNSYKTNILDKYTARVKDIIDTLKFNIFIEQFKEIYGQKDSDKKRTDFIKELKKIKEEALTKEQREFLEKLFSNLDSLKTSSIETFGTFVKELKDQADKLAKELVNKARSLKSAKSKYIEDLLHHFDKNVKSVYDKLSNTDISNTNISEQLQGLEKLIEVFNDFYTSSSSIDSQLIKYLDEFKELTKKVEEFVSEISAYKTLVFGFINHEAWEKNKTNNDLMKLKMVKFSLPFLEVLTTNKNEHLNQLLKELKDQSVKTELEKTPKFFEEFKKMDKELPKLEKAASGRSNSGVLGDYNEFFNKHIDKMNESSKKLDKQLPKLKEHLLDLGTYFNLLISDVNKDHELYDLYNDSVKKASKLMTDIRKYQIVKEVHNFDKNLEYNKLENENDLIVAKSKIELIDILTKRNILKPGASEEEINKVIFKADLTYLKKDKKNLLVTLKGVDTQNPFGNQKRFGTKTVKLSIDAEAKSDVIRATNDFFNVLGYKKMVSPSVLKEESDLRNPMTGEIEKTFDVYADAYENLVDELIEKVPYAAQWLEGPHIKKVIDEDGVMQYKLENGKYLGFTKDDRIGLWAILKMSDKNFKGISTDFLKFVGAHEYGHHITLNGAHDLGNKGSDPIFISALTPGATPNINNYYSREAVDLFLKARTHIELETKRLLDQFGVIKDYGEYATFNFAKKTKDGKIDFSTKENENALEKDTDIWGVNIEDPSIRKAFSNKKRRFLQDFAGLLEAVKKRQEENGLTTEDDKKWLSPFDLWVANAIDFYSGTLNPTVNSSNKNNEVVKYMYKDKNTGELKFQPASLKMLDGILKDGKGELIKFNVVKNGEVETVEPIVVEGTKDQEGNYTKITKVLVHNKDGSPIVNVPLNVDLTDKNSSYYDPKAVEFANEKIKTVEKTIKSLIVDKFSINGWNKADTRVDLDANIDINYPALKNIFGTRLPNTINDMFKKIYSNYVQNRDPEKGTYKSNDQSIPKMKYYNLDGTENINHQFGNAPSNLIYANATINGKNGTNGKVDFNSLLKTLFTGGNSLNNMVNGGAAQVLWLGKDKMYMPNVKLQESYTDLFFLSNLPKEYEQIFEAKKVLKWMSRYTPTFISSELNRNGIWNMMDNLENLITFSDATQADFSRVSKLRLNYVDFLRRIDSNILNGLFGTFAEFKDNILEFNDYNKWLEFVTVDLTKAKYNEKENRVDWDMSYVKSKIDIDQFKKKYEEFVLKTLDSVPSITDNQKQAFKEFYKKANEDNSDQMWANEIMRRFSSSLFAMYNSAHSIKQIQEKKELAWIFDSTHGYGDFKKAEFKLKGADKEKWEIGIEDLLKAYEKFAKDLKADLSQLNLVDALVIDGKTQLYSDETIIHISQNKFELFNIFSSLLTAQFHTSPSPDVLEYFHNKTERKFNELFSDYTYSFAEVINRDNLQITYSPSNHDFGNMPSFLSNISEATTGLEYVVDGTTTAKWKKRAIKINDRDGRNGIVNTILDYEKLVDNEVKNKSEALNLKYRNSKLSQKSNLSDDSNYNNSYFGEFQSINNGWFKDRWYRDFLDFKLYDDDGKPIIDDTIRITDLENKKVTSRVNAYWQYYIQSQGVGKRNISGIWRDATKDAVAMFGYLSSDVANKANYLAFKNQETGEVKTVKINKQFSSNMFYYKTQNIENEAKYEAAKTDEERNAIRHTLAHEKYDYKDTNGHHKGTGFVSWVSDYAIMSKYQNALLTPGQKYSVYFSSDKKGTKDIIKTDLGDFQSIAENGKTFSQAPIRMEKSKDPVKVDANGFKHYENTLYVYDQFNGVK